MDSYYTTELQEYLHKNEKLIWSGQPKKGILFRSPDAVLIPFSLFWCGFVVFCFVNILKSPEPFPGVFFLIPFMLVGLLFVFGRFIIDARQRANSFYGLTNERIIIKSGTYKKSLHSVSIDKIDAIEYDEYSDGSGTIHIGSRNPVMIWGRGMNWWPGMDRSPVLDTIQDVKSVYRKIGEIRHASRK